MQTQSALSTIALLLPVLWAKFGPIATTAITAFVNQVVGAYVPRPIQLILSAVITAVLAGFTSAGEGADLNTAEVVGGMTGLLGLGMQAYTSIQPKTLLTTAPGSK